VVVKYQQTPTSKETRHHIQLAQVCTEDSGYERQSGSTESSVCYISQIQKVTTQKHQKMASTKSLEYCKSETRELQESASRSNGTGR
jgi:hypothetical protein